MRKRERLFEIGMGSGVGQGLWLGLLLGSGLGFELATDRTDLLTLACKCCTHGLLP